MNITKPTEHNEADWLHRLVGLIPPPVSPVYAGSEILWEEAEKKLGSEFPSDFKRYIDIYGAGSFSWHLGIWSPFDPQKNTFSQMNELVETGGPEIHSSIRNRVSAELLLPIGSDPNRGLLYWIREGSPDKWPLFYTHLEGLEYDILEWPLTRFLYEWQSGSFIPNVYCGYDHIRLSGAYFTPSGSRPPK